MAQINQFEIDNGWEEVVVKSRYGDTAHYRVNAVTKQVLIKTRVGDGNAADWRGCNTTYEAVMQQNPQPVRKSENVPIPSPEFGKSRQKGREEG